MVVVWTLATDPSDNYLECNGQVVDNNKYPKLYKLMHNTPDYQGVFLRGLGGNSAALGELQGDAIRNIIGTFGLEADDYPSSNNINGVFYTKKGHIPGRAGQSDGSTDSLIEFNASRVVPTASENRPINKAIRYFIKAK